MGRITTYALTPLAPIILSKEVPGSDEGVIAAAKALVLLARKEGRQERYIIENATGLGRAFTAEDILLADSLARQGCW